MAGMSHAEREVGEAPPGQEHEDDYMSMAIPEPEAPKHETSAQRRARKQKQAEVRARPKSKQELESDEAALRDAALATSIAPTSRGARMLAKLGYTEGSALGAKDRLDARLEPIGVDVKEGRTGIGMESEKKRKFREEAEKLEGGEKRQRAGEGEYRERVRREREQKRLEGQVLGAMKVLEGMEEGEERMAKTARGPAEEAIDRLPRTIIDQTDEDGAATEEALKTAKAWNGRKPLSKVNVLYRTLIRQRAVIERERRMRYDLHQSLSANQAHDDLEEDGQDKLAWGTEVAERELDEEDSELAAFQALEPAEQLGQILRHLREKYRYCFWCKFAYPDDELDGCPGLTEEEHD